MHWVQRKCSRQCRLWGPTWLLWACASGEVTDPPTHPTDESSFATRPCILPLATSAPHLLPPHGPLLSPHLNGFTASHSLSQCFPVPCSSSAGRGRARLWTAHKERLLTGVPRACTGGGFPASYNNTIFIAEHGSWARTPAVGYRVAAVALMPNGTAATHIVFASGWLLKNGTVWGVHPLHHRWGHR